MAASKPAPAREKSLPGPSTVPLPAPATAVAAPATATATVALAEPATDVAARGVMVGLRDGAIIMNRLTAHLGEQVPELAKTTVQQWGRHARVTVAEEVAATPEQFTLQIPPLRQQWVLDRQGCSLVTAVSEGPPHRAACPWQDASQVRMAAALVAMARPDLRDGLRIETLRADSRVSPPVIEMRLTMPAWRLRWTVDVRRDGLLMRWSDTGLSAKAEWVNNVAMLTVWDAPQGQWTWAASARQPLQRLSVRTAAVESPSEQPKATEKALGQLQQLATSQHALLIGVPEVVVQVGNGKATLKRVQQLAIGAGGPQSTVVVAPKAPVQVAGVFSGDKAQAAISQLAPGCYVVQLLDLPNQTSEVLVLRQDDVCADSP